MPFMLFVSGFPSRLSWSGKVVSRSPHVFFHVFCVCVACLVPFWLVLSGCLYLHVFLNVSPNLASRVRLFGCLPFFHFVPCVSEFISLPIDLSLIIALVVLFFFASSPFWCVSSIICFSPFVSHFMCPYHSYASLSGGVLSSFHHSFMCK